MTIMIDTRINNNFIVIDKGRLSMYALDDRPVWKVGRPTNENRPDIQMYTGTISREHGTIENVEGSWFYKDRQSENGTVLIRRSTAEDIRRAKERGSYIKTLVAKRCRGRRIDMRDGDIFIFGGGDRPIDGSTVWAMYVSGIIDSNWRAVKTEGAGCLEFQSGNIVERYIKPETGMVVSMRHGLAIYMGDITYVSGDISIEAY